MYELTGPRSQDLHAIAREFSAALGRAVTYTDISPETFEAGLKGAGLPEHAARHIAAMDALHRAGGTTGRRTAWSG